MTEDVDIREVQIAPLRFDNNSVVIRASAAIEAAGLADGGSLRFDPAAVDELGLLPALGSPTSADGRREPLTRSIQHKGAGQTLSVAIPPAALEALGIDADDVDWDNPPELTVWAGPQLIALERPEQRTISVDRDVDESDRDEPAAADADGG